MVKSMESSYLTDDYLLGPKMNNPQTSTISTIISLHIKLHVFELRVNIQVHIFNVR